MGLPRRRDRVEHQRLAAEQAVRWLTNVKGIINRIRVTASADASGQNRQRSLERNSDVDESLITAEATRGEAALSRTAPSWSKLAEGQRLAWRAARRHQRQRRDRR